MLLTAYFVLVLINVSLTEDKCSNIEFDCDACFSYSKDCAWCQDEIFSLMDSRCRSRRKNMLSFDYKFCLNVTDPESKVIMVKDEYFSYDAQDRMELMPQHVLVKARPNTTLSFDLTYAPSRARPVEIYYLFDSSRTMVPYREQFVKQLENIHRTFKEFSTEVQFELGLLGTNASSTGCIGEDLDIDIIPKVDVIETIQNDDGVLSILDGLIHLLDSKAHDWWSYSRRIIVLFCDPNDADDILKFPTSIAVDSLVRQINKRIKEHKINIIFAVVKALEPYNVLNLETIGSSYVEIPVKNVDFATILKEGYMETIDTLELDFGDLPSYVNLTISPPCKIVSGRRCTRSAMQHETSMTAEIKMFDCPNDFQFKKTFYIKAIGVGKWTIDTFIMCSCDCSEIVEVKSKQCSGMGDYTCGICKCYDGRYGAECECTGDSPEEAWQMCRGPNDHHKTGCYGHGRCVCGVCNCHIGYSGKYCSTKCKDCILDQV